MEENNVKTLYVVRMAYCITLEAETEADAIRGAQYASVEDYSRGTKITHLEQRVIRTIQVPLPKPEPAPEPKPEIEQAAAAPIPTDDSIPF